MNSVERRPEVTCAAKWWADALFRPAPQDNGDAFQSGFATMAMMTVAVRCPMTKAERDQFEEFVATRLDCHVVEGGWNRAVHDPVWGSAVRAIGTDYHPDMLLESALIAAVGSERAQQLSLLWPIKTFMWIDPGSVKVRHGYGAEIEVLYQRPDTQVEP